MSRNPVIPYAVIAVVGVLLVIIISYVGVNHRNAEQSEDGSQDAVSLDVEAIYKNQCAACHGDDLSGSSAPDLTQVGSTLSEDEIKDIIINGVEGDIGVMPGGLVDNEQAAEIAEWLSEMD